MHFHKIIVPMPFYKLNGHMHHDKLNGHMQFNKLNGHMECNNFSHMQFDKLNSYFLIRASNENNLFISTFRHLFHKINAMLYIDKILLKS